MSGIGFCPRDGSQVGHGTVWPSLIVCSTFSPAFIVDRKNWGGNDFGSVCDLNSPLSVLSDCRDLAVFRVQISLPCISAKITPIDSLLPSNLLSLAHPKDAPPFHPHLLQISIHFPGTLVLSCLTPPVPVLSPFPFLICSPIQFSLFHLPDMTALLPLVSEIQPCSFGSFFLFRFFWSMENSVDILYFMANIHL